VLSRTARLAARSIIFQSSNAEASPITTSEPQKRHFRVQIVEVDSAYLLRGAPAPSEPNEEDTSDGLWAWPMSLPKIDGVIVCYDVNDLASFKGVPQLCGKSTCSFLLLSLLTLLSHSGMLCASSPNCCRAMQVRP